MENETKVFNYVVEGLSYTVTVYEQDGAFFADIHVNEGQMDVNAIYYGDDDMTGTSESLSGPLNMNGGGTTFEGEKIQWDTADQISEPGLGPEGEDKESFLTEGDTLTRELSIDSLDDIDYFGIRATSTSTEEGSIKAVSGDPEEPEDPEDPEDPIYDKVFFVYDFDESGAPIAGFNILAEEPEDNEFNIPSLPEGTEPTFANFLAYFEEIGGDVTETESVIFYELDENDVPQEEFRIEAPADGFLDSEELMEAYDLALEEYEAGATDPEADAADLIAALSLETDVDASTYEDDPADDTVDTFEAA